MKAYIIAMAWSLAPLLGATQVIQAGPILQPASASTDMGTLPSPGFSIDNVRNQSGLSISYTSLVTDFDAYIGSNPSHSSLNQNFWSSSLLSRTGNVDFDLGGPRLIDAYALWNLGGNLPSSIIGFTLLGANDATFIGATTLGSFTANPNTGPSSAVIPQVFTFAATSVSFVRMSITSNNNGDNTAFREAAFRLATQAIPEPSSLFMAGASVMAGLAYSWQRRRLRNVLVAPLP